MPKTAHEMQMEKLRHCENREESIRRESHKEWWRCGISLGGLLLLYPLFKLDLEDALDCLIMVLFVVCGHVFLFSLAGILQLEKEQEACRAKRDLLAELDNRNV